MIFLKLLFVTCSFSFAKEAPLEPPYTRQKDSAIQRPLEKPESISEEGEYFYKSSNKDGVIQHKLDNLPPITGAAYVRVSSTSAFDLTGESGTTYKDVYGDDPGFGFVFDYEWQMFHWIGKWTAKISTGVTAGNGQGQFTDPTNAGIQPREKFLLVLLPNTFLLNYKMRFSDTQWFIPYFEGGPGYYTYYEASSDGKSSAFGGAPILAAAGGLLISMSLIDSNAAGVLYEDYGINHMWFDIQFRRNESLDKSKDFSANVISTGFGFAF